MEGRQVIGAERLPKGEGRWRPALELKWAGGPPRFFWAMDSAWIS